ncbi:MULTISPECIES: hypothetical protein [Streptomyces]|uniref:Uncharacterized protein n=1 Tax=Streptomyces ramulosus TaxID=47762 RepID=A0ABW1FF15_9ACTN
MKFDVFQIIGMVAVAVCGQGAIRLLVDHGDTGVLGGLHAGFGVTLGGYAAGVAAGAVLAGWSHGRAKALGRRG